MNNDFKRSFSSSVAGYNRTEVDTFISNLMAEAQKLEQYNAMAIREQTSLRERIVQLEESLKLAKSPGYAQVGAQFEQTLRLAESEAARLLNDADRESQKVLQEASAEAERIKFAAQEEAEADLNKARREAKSLLASATKQASSLIEEAEQQIDQASKERAQLEKQANVIRSEAETYAANVKAELQVEVEKIQNANSRLLKRNAELDAEIARKLDEGERQALEIFRRVESEATELRNKAERDLSAATAEATSLIENAEETLEKARIEADKVFNEANSISLNLLADTRARAEALAIRSLDLTRDAMAEAEYRLSKLPSQKAALEEFLEGTKNLLTPEQQVLLSRRKSINQQAQEPVDAEVVDAEQIPDNK